MKFLATNSDVPVPKVYAAFVEEETSRTFIIMECIPGDNQEKLLPSLTSIEKEVICKIVRDAINELRKIPLPDYLGTVNRQPCRDGVFWIEDIDPSISGPFANQQGMNNGILKRLACSEKAPYVRLVQGMVEHTLHDHRTVFTHGDLQPKNTMVERVGGREDGSLTPGFKIILVDWEISGWYPEFWEFCSASILCRFKPDWLELLTEILDHYPVEYLMMQVVYSTMFY